MNKKEINAIKFTFILFCIGFVLVAGKAFKIQLIDSAKLIAKSKSQYFRESRVYPRRGNIYDRNGNPLAINVQTYSIFTIPKNVRDKVTTYKLLSDILPRHSYKYIKRKIKKRKKFTWISRKIKLNKEQVASIKELKGVYIDAVPMRLYPNNELLSQLLGFVGVDNVGLSGIEYLFDKELKGKPKVTKYIKDNKGRPVKFESIDNGNLAKDIHLTIDKEIQFIAEKYLKEKVEEYSANKGGIGVMDVRSGEILAIANYPTFDPNNAKKSKVGSRKLSFVSDPFEPGSTFKLFTAASALENKIATTDTNYYCEEGRLKISGHVIKEAEAKKKYEWLSLEEIIKYSSNVGTTKVAFDLTYPRLYKTLKDFGIGLKTGIELPGESRGIISEKENVSPLKLSNISFGQGVATTGIQMLAAYGAIANNGVFTRPTILKGQSIKYRQKRVMSEGTAMSLTQMFVSAVEDGTGTKAKIKHFTIAGKTSTAQRPNSDGGYKGYVPGFIGYPTNVQDRFVIYVYVDNPKGRKYYGGTVVGPVFKKVAEHILFKNKEFNQVALNTLGFKNKFLEKAQPMQRRKKRIKMGEVPNFVGLDKRSAIKMAKKLGLKIFHRGIGVVKKQSLSPGSLLKAKPFINLLYVPPSYE